MWKMHRKSIFILISVIAGEIIRQYKNSDSTLQYLNPLFSESNATTWAVLHTAKENDTAIRHFGGQLLHLLCGCKMWFRENASLWEL